MMTQPYEQGGIIGPNQKALIDALKGGQAPTLPVPPIAPGAPDFPGSEPPTQAPAQLPSAAPTTGLGAYANKLGGYDTAKFADPNRSEKYKIGEIESRYDPTKGVSPEMLNELNALGIAQFSGGGDKLTVNNTKNDPRFGHGGTGDIINRFNAGDGSATWAPWFVDEGGGQQPQARQGGGMPSFGGSSINGMLQSDAQGNIQQALGALQQPGMLQQLIAALQGGQ